MRKIGLSAILLVLLSACSPGGSSSNVQVNPPSNGAPSGTQATRVGFVKNGDLNGASVGRASEIIALFKGQTLPVQLDMVSDGGKEGRQVVGSFEIDEYPVNLKPGFILRRYKGETLVKENDRAAFDRAASEKLEALVGTRK